MLNGMQVGDQVVRREVHERYGGRRQGGIGPSTKAPVVLFFTDPATGHQHGYYDGWGTDGLFHYVGEGQRGDQQLTQGNKAILNHQQDGRTLEGFAAAGSRVTYLGEFELVGYYFTDAHETGELEVMREVVVFKLRALGSVPVQLPSLPYTPPTTTAVNVVPVEEAHTERSFTNPSSEPREIERKESALVSKYRQYLHDAGHTVNRLSIVPAGESRPLFSDLWDEDTRELIEAKATVTRDHIRMAVGQLLDYGRYADAESHAVLLPGCPRPDLVAYLHSARIVIVYPDGDSWQRLEPGQ